MALALLAVGGCAYRDAVVLENGEKVDSLYYHESRMPDEVMVEMSIDFSNCKIGRISRTLDPDSFSAIVFPNGIIPVDSLRRDVV